MLTLSADLQLTFVRLWITFCVFLATLFFVVDLFRKPSNSDMALWLKQRILTNGNAFCFRLQTLVKSLTSQLWKKCQIELFSKKFYDIVPSLSEAESLVLHISEDFAFAWFFTVSEQTAAISCSVLHDLPQHFLLFSFHRKDPFHSVRDVNWSMTRGRWK